MNSRGRLKTSEDIWLELPVPPAVNRKYISRSFVVSPEWRQFKEYVSKVALVNRLRPLTGDVEARIIWYRSARQRTSDIDSRLKSVLDALEAGSEDGFGAYLNDRQIKTLTVRIEDDEPERPRIVVHVEPKRG